MMRYWDDYKGFEKVNKGAFSNKEQLLLNNFIGKYLKENNCDYDELSEILVRNKKPTDSFWNEIGSILPKRTIYSIYNYIKRKYNNKNNNGKWSDDEISALKELYKEYGNNWKQISEFMNRTEKNIKDKIKNLNNFKSFVTNKGWDLKDIFVFIKYLESNYNVKILRSYDINTEFKDYIVKHNAGNTSSFYYNCNNILVLLPNIIFGDYIGIVSNVKWSEVHKLLPHKSVDDLRNFYNNVLLKSVKFEHDLKGYDLNKLLKIDDVYLVHTVKNRTSFGRNMFYYCKNIKKQF